MTNEIDFQRKLTARINDWQTRLVFADWLQDHNDPRAEGYRALGTLKIHPIKISHFKFPWIITIPDWRVQSPPTPEYNSKCEFPLCWFKKIFLSYYQPKSIRLLDLEYGLTVFKTRRIAEDAAALAFSNLSEVSKSLILKKSH